MCRLDVTNEKWDFLIVLDACRYDYFEAMYRDYIQGDLEKRISAGSSTNQWRDVNFQGKYDDIVYISANPHFTEKIPVSGYVAGEHFHKVCEVWQKEWDGGVVRPETVNKEAIKAFNEYPEKRFVIHYLQPHTPYISLGEDAKGYADSHGQAGRRLIGEDDYQKAPNYKKRMLKWLLRLFSWNNILGNHPEWFLRKWLNLPPRSPGEYVVCKYNKKILRNAYRENLRIVLEQVSELLKYLAGRIVITADHGELLGENRCYGHPPNSDNPILVEVPWLVIDKDKADISQTAAELEAVKATDESSLTNADQADDQQVKDKLRELGYID